MTGWIAAGLWGLLAGSALLIGAAVGYLASLPRSLVAGIMAFGSGVLISALVLDLMEEAYRHGGFGASAAGLLGGAVVYTAANVALSHRGGRHRKRSAGQQPSESESPGSGLSIAVGALLDGIPESIAIGVSLLSGGSVSFAAVVAIFVSNLPEGLSSSVGMKKAGRSPVYVFGLWGIIAAVSGLAAAAGYAVFGGFSRSVAATTTASAAGAMLAMLVDTMIPEAFDEARDFAGLVTVVGFLASFVLSKLGG